MAKPTLRGATIPSMESFEILLDDSDIEKLAQDSLMVFAQKIERRIKEAIWIKLLDKLVTGKWEVGSQMISIDCARRAINSANILKHKTDTKLD